MTEAEELLAWILAQPVPRRVDKFTFGGTTIGSLCYATGPVLHKTRAITAPVNMRMRVLGNGT